MGKRHEQIFHQKGQQAHEKMFNIICYKRNVNENAMRYLYILIRLD